MTQVNEQRYEQTFNVGERADLTLRNVRGGIEISGWDRPQVSIVAIKKMGTEWGARESFEGTTVEMEQDGPHVRVRTHHRDGGGLFGWMGIGRTPPQVFYTVKVPVTSDISVRTVEGPLAISDIIGSVYARTVGGDMRLQRISGQIITNSVDADLKGDELGGTVAAKTVSGDVTISKSQLTSLWAKSVDGDVHMESTIDPSGTYEAGSVSGDFHLIIPPDSRATVETRNVSGRVTCDVPCQVLEQGRRHWRATINGGGASIHLKTVDGDLTITSTTKLPAATAAPPQPAPTATPASAEWPEMSILKAVERGELTVEEALAKLSALDKS